MKCIKFNMYQQQVKYVEKGKKVDGHFINYAEACISDRFGILEVPAGEAAIILRELYRRYVTPSFSLLQAESIVKQLLSIPSTDGEGGGESVNMD